MTPKTSASHFSQVLGQVDGLLAVPYGYTISVWAAGAAAMAHYGLPDLTDILLFAGGAVLAFFLLAYGGRRRVRQHVPDSVPAIVLANGLALVVAVIVSVLCSLLPWPIIGFTAVGFTVTLVYGLGLAAFLTFVPDLIHRRSTATRSRPDAPYPSSSPDFTLHFSRPQSDSPIWLFDLDNTLYPADAGIMDAISERISLFIEKRLGLPPVLADAVRESYYGRYGSSIGGVLRHCKVDVEEFMTFVHDLPVADFIEPDEHLDRLLTSLSGEKYVFTNSPADYARKVLRALGVEQHFRGIFDIRFAGMEGKPAPVFYQNVLVTLGHPAGECWFVEDSVQNLAPAKALGCRTVWITQTASSTPPFVDRVIHKLDELIELSSESTSTSHP